MTATQAFPFYPVGYKKPYNVADALARATAVLERDTVQLEQSKRPTLEPTYLTPNEGQRLVDALRKHIQNQPTIPGMSRVANIAANHVAVCSEYLQAYQRQTARYTHSVNEVTRLRRELATSKEPEALPTLTYESLTETLATTNYYVPNSLKITGTPNEKGEYTQLCIEYSIKDVRMRVAPNLYVNINNGNPVTLLLTEPIHIKLYPCIGKVTVYPDASRKQKDEWEHTQRAHPHIMQSKSPCFGGFENAVSTLFANADIHSLFFVLEAFFEQANAHDSAGRTWPYWIQRNEHIPVRRIVTVNNYECMEYPDYTIFEDGTHTVCRKYYWCDHWGSLLNNIETLATLKLKALQSGITLPDAAFDKSVVHHRSQDVFRFSHDIR